MVNNVKYKALLSAVLLVLVVSGCEDKKSSTSSLPQIAGNQTGKRVIDTALVKQGNTIYQKYCSSCHGAHAEGDPNWRTPGPDGKYPPPPLNGTGHAWHHPTPVLEEIIKHGTAPQGNMPAWEGKLTDQEIKAVVAWFQSLWPDEVYAAWRDIDRRSRK